MRRIGARTMLSMPVLVASIVVGAVGPVSAQGADVGPSEAVAEVERIKAKRLKFGKTKVDDWVAHHDRTGDVRTQDGVIYPDAADFTDIERVLITENNVPGKLVREWERNFPLGTADTYRGEQAEIRKRVPYVWIIVETAGRPPRGGDPAVQLIVSAYGPDGQPLAPEAGIVSGNGTVQFSRSGLFNGGNLGSGTTRRVGLPAGEEGDIYNDDARDFGRFDRKNDRIFHAASVPKGTRYISVTLETSQDGVQLFDELELSVGSTLFDLQDRFHGAVRGTDPLVCRDVRTRTTPADLVSASLAADAIWLESSVQVSDDFDLAALDGLTDSITLISADADGDGSAVGLDGDWQVDEVRRTATIRVELPSGSTRWRLDPDGGPDGSSVGELSAHLPLQKALQETIGDGTFEARPDMVGRLGGARGCARFQFAQSSCAAAEDADLATILGLDPNATSYNPLVTSSGIDVCGGLVAGATAPAFILARRDAPTTLEAFVAQVAASGCVATPFGSADTQQVLDCSADGFQSLWALVTPDADGTAGASYIATLDVAMPEGAAVADETWREAARIIGSTDGVIYGAWVVPEPAAEDDEADLLEVDLVGE